MDHPVLAEVAKATPPSLYAAASFAGFTLPDFITYCTAIYAVGLAISTLYAGYKKFKIWWHDRRYTRVYRKLTRQSRRKQWP